MKEEYEVEYSRFFNYPPNSKPLSPSSTLLRPLSKSRKLRQGGGTWLSSSKASLQLLTNPQLLLLVSLRDNIHNQKFAIRFSDSSESLAFVNFLKESMKDVRKIGLPSCNERSEISPQTEIINSNGIYNRAEEGLRHVDRGNCSYPLPSSLNYQGEQYSRPQETALPYETGGTYGALPPSFTELLADSCTEVEQELPKILEGVDLKSLTARYMTGSSFHDMLSKLEKVISDMGGDLALQFS